MMIRPNYCKYGNFGVIFISQNLNILLIRKFLNLRVSAHVFNNVYGDSLLARTLNLLGNQFANISKN